MLLYIVYCKIVENRQIPVIELHSHHQNGSTTVLSTVCQVRSPTGFPQCMQQIGRTKEILDRQKEDIRQTKQKYYTSDCPDVPLNHSNIKEGEVRDFIFRSPKAWLADRTHILSSERTQHIRHHQCQLYRWRKCRFHHYSRYDWDNQLGWRHGDQEHQIVRGVLCFHTWTFGVKN